MSILGYGTVLDMSLFNEDLTTYSVVGCDGELFCNGLSSPKLSVNVIVVNRSGLHETRFGIDLTVWQVIIWRHYSGPFSGLN
jgi:hypothetical protein